LHLRRFLVILLVGLLAMPAAGAQGTVARTPGAVELSRKDGHGFAKISRRGTLLGRVRRGRVVATRNVFVGHWSSKRRVSDDRVAYRGTRMTLRVYSSDGRWRVRLRGRGINVSGVVNGWLTLDGVNSGSTGLYSIEGRRYRPWPLSQRTFSLRR
jgi:hypothetical protein